MEAPKIDLPITERIHLMATGKIPIPESPFPEFQEVKTTLIASIRPYEAEPRDPEGKRNISKYNKAYRYLLAGSYVRSSELCDEIRDSYLTALDDAKNNNSNKDPHLPAKIPLAHAILFWKASMIKVVLTAMMNTAPAQYRGTFLLLPIAIRDRVLRDVFGGGGGAGAIPEVLRDGDFGLLFYLFLEESFRMFYRQGKEGWWARPCFAPWAEELGVLEVGARRLAAGSG